MDVGSNTGADSSNTEPEFEVNEAEPGAFILLRNQPQDPNGITVGDEFEIGVHLGNPGGEPATGDVSVELAPPNEEASVQTASTSVAGEEEIPPGEARFFTLGQFDATVAGDWKLTAASGIEQVSDGYDETIEVKERSGD
ncbi:hypothetical protein [Natrialba asiatica]|uniref:CARDB domain-containing protein n=1 Tax=Natrialba asiatica (strain ATCC 700177 / DSM 12278 / JCM 9576 / FERM P-10747 / NBRC 102637 / 172P1) TaxID=29540 RepID=M0ATX4_NATA1|nr:hypothetical protein [Natrialba asiatica]ELZ01787.1 hypothetical protein C481_09712 [Natrialba asiatica DSM 12278]